MLAIESLFGSNLFGQLRTIIQMPPSRDVISPSATGRDLERKQPEPTMSSTMEKHDVPTEISQTPRQTVRLRRKRPIITRPEPGSLYDIMHDHSGTSLYVLPICWTDLHAKVLGVEFRRKPIIIKPVPDHDPGRWLEPSHIARNITSELHVLVRDQPAVTKAFAKTRAIKHVMAALFPDTLSHPKVGVELDMYFGLRVFRKAVRIPCLWKTPNSAVEASFESATTIPSTSFGRLPTPPQSSPNVAPNKPMLAYINRSHLAMTRQNLFRVAPGPDNGPNEAVASLQRLRSKMLIPANINHDSFFVGIIIAMAQAHFYRGRSSKSSSQATGSPRSSNKTLRMPPPEFHDVKIQIITHEEDNESSPKFIIYTATVTADFLERFMHPHKAPLPQSQMEAGAAGLKIEYTPVAFWPILGLKERLAKALGRDIAGDPMFGDPEYIGLWDALVDQPRLPLVQPAVPIFTRPPRAIPAMKNSLKRRRHGVSHREQLRPALSEMLNSSFEEETTPDSSADDLDRPVLSPDSKRRRTAASSRGGSGKATGNPNPLEVC